MALAARVAAEGRGIVAVVNKLDASGSAQPTAGMQVTCIVLERIRSILRSLSLQGQGQDTRAPAASNALLWLHRIPGM